MDHRHIPPDLATVLTLLRGEAPSPKTDWLAVIALANRCWLCPTLWTAIQRQAFDIPHDAQTYLSFIHAENERRNTRLRSQLEEAVRALNGVGITPTLIKGTVHLFTASEDNLGARMMGDLDVLVAPHEQATARRVLLQSGYQLWQAPDEPSDVLFRQSDAAPIELHILDVKHPQYQSLNRIERPSKQWSLNGATVLVPDATVQLLHLILHDQLRDGEYWRGSFDLRHLVDAAALIRTGAVDFQALHNSLKSGLETCAVNVQLRLISTFFCFETIQKTPKYSEKLHFWRRMRQLRPDNIGHLFRILGKGAWLLRCLLRGEVSVKTAIRRAFGIASAEPEKLTPIMGLGGGPKL